VRRGFNLSRERKKLPRFCQNATRGSKRFLWGTGGFSSVLLRRCNTALHKKARFDLKTLYQVEQHVTMDN
jgi:hypothetical protein